MATPVKMSAQMRAWNGGGGTQGAGPSHSVQTPRRPRFSEVITSPEVPLQRSAMTTARDKKPAARLPGFFNSFANTSTPTKSASQRAKEKGKGKPYQSMVMDDDGQAFFAPQDPRSSPPSSPLGPIPMELEDHPMEDFAESLQAAPITEREALGQSQDIEADGDVKMGDDAIDAQQEIEMGIEPPNWRDEVCMLSCRVVFCLEHIF